MTARPIVPESRRRPLCAAVALILVMVAVLLAAGCIGGDVTREQDLSVIKLNQDGSMAWMKTIDSGKDDEITDVIQTSDGGYTIAGGYSTISCNRMSHFPTIPKVIRLSDKGDIVWEREYTSELADRYENSIRGLVQIPENGYYLISQRGMIVKISSSGIPQGSQLITFDIPNRTIIGPVIRTSDGGSAFAGFVHRCQIIDGTEECSGTNDNDKPFVAKLDRDGNKVWFTKMSSDNFWNVISLIELPDNHGYIGQGQGTTITHPLFKLDKNGLAVNSSSINSIDDIYKIQAVPDGFLAFAVNGSTNHIIDIFSYTDEGVKTKTAFLETRTDMEAPPYHDVTIAARNNSFFNININGSYIYAQKLDSSGKPVWNRQVTSYATDMALIHIRTLIEADDGGYLIVLGVEKQKSCHRNSLSDFLDYFWKMIIESRIQRS